MEENITVEAGKTQETNSIDYAKLAEVVANAVNNKNAKNEKSIVQSNFDKLDEADKEKAYKAYETLKNKESEKVTNRISQLEKENAELLKAVEDYKTKEKQTTFKNSATKTLKNLGVKDDAKIDMLLTLAGQDIYKQVDDENVYSDDKGKELFEGIAKKYNIKFVEEVKKEIPQIQIGAPKQETKQIDTTKLSLSQKIKQNM
jgi:hypothetical protein